MRGRLEKGSVKSRKTALLVLMLCLMSTPILATGIRPVRSALPVHNIDTGLDYATISDAIWADETVENHTIIVDPGIYQENVWLPAYKPGLRIIGQNPATTVIDANAIGEAIWSAADNIIVSGFTIRNGVTGICLYYVNNNTFTGNTITANVDYGIYLDSSANNAFIGNNITQNGWGIFLWYSNTIRLHYNNLINNLYQVESTESDNLWDNGYPFGGNYWSDYSVRYPLVVDEYHGENQDVAGSDEIWDSPYEIDVDNRDRYPLVEPWSQPKLEGDVNEDGVVDIIDLSMVAVSYGRFSWEPEYNRKADLNYDGVIDVFDISLVCIHYGETDP